MSRRSDPDAHLAELNLFTTATKSELLSAARLLTPVNVDAGQVLLRQGAAPREFLIVADGLVSVTRDLGDGSEVLAEVTPGGVLGEMSLLHGGPRSATVTTVGPATVFAATPREFFALLDAVPSAAAQIVRTANERERANRAA